MNTLVISAGGSKGAYGVGILYYYRKEIGKYYDSYIGTSTGSLIAALGAADKIDNLKEAYTTITHKDIFTCSPFKIKKNKNGIYKYSINHWNIIKNFINGGKSLGDTTIFREKTIPRWFKLEDFNRVNENSSLEIAVTNLTFERSEMIKSNTKSYDEFLDYLWASTCAPPFMSIVDINNNQYIDGGTMNMIPIRKAILNGSDEIDVIVLSEEQIDVYLEKVRNIMHFIIKSMYMMMNKIKRVNMDLDYLAHLTDKPVKINFHFTENRLTNNSLIFDRNQMLDWFELGYNYAKNKKYKSYLLDKNGYKLIN